MRLAAEASETSPASLLANWLALLAFSCNGEFKDKWLISNT